MKIMYSKRLSLFILSVIGGVTAQFDLQDVCETDEGTIGVCEYEDLCKYARELRVQEIHPKECSYEGRTLIACCPPDHTTGIMSRVFINTEGIIANDNLTCHYDGDVPLLCCPTPTVIAEPPEPAGCPPLPSVQTPPFQKLGYRSAWEQCTANERYVDICEQSGQRYTRSYRCSIPVTTLRITEGEPAPLMEFPHMAVLGCNNKEGGDNQIVWIGGGTLISPYYILTAGHVLISVYGRIRYAFLGGLDKTKIKEGEIFGITELIPYKAYTTAEKKHDIALVKLNKQVTFSQFIRPACLPLPGIDPENDVRIIAGWGKTIFKINSTNFLQKAIVDIVDGAQCKNNLTWSNLVWDDKTMICAKGWLKRMDGDGNMKYTDTCQGDSGGPLMYKVTNVEFHCNYVVDGIVSWGNTCGNGAPASYTRVSAYLDWIVDTVWPELL